MFSKKAQLPLIKTILILLISSGMLISFIIILLNSGTINIDERKTNTHLVESKLFNSNCFSDKYATIEKNKFTQDNLNTCFLNLNENIIFRVKLEKEGIVYYVHNKKDEFDNKKNYCSSQESNLRCTHLKYPISLIDANEELETDVLTLDIITLQ